MRKLLPSAEFLRSVLDYDPETGRLAWKRRENIRFNTRLAGKEAGHVNTGRPDGSNRYRFVGLTIKGAYLQFPASRIIWKMMTNEEPPDVVDHRDGSELNNRWDNLRAATNGANIQNSKLRKDNTLGVKGVVYRPEGHKHYRAQIVASGKAYRGPARSTIEEAATDAAFIRQSVHGEFARVK